MSRLRPGRSAAATNLIPNGGFETNTTGWTTGGTNTIARSTEQAGSGAASLKCTYSNNAQLAVRGSLTLSAVAHSGSVGIYIPTAFGGGAVDARFDAYVGISGTVIVQADMDIRDAWQLVAIPNVTPDAGDVLGSFQVRTTGTVPGVGEFIYIDEAQVEAGVGPTAYIETDGATATRNASNWFV